MNLEIVEKKNYTEVWMWRSTFKTMYKAKDSIWLDKGDRIHIPTGTLGYKKYIAYTEKQLIRKSGRTKIIESGKTINSLLSEDTDRFALDTLWDIEMDLGIFDCNDNTYVGQNCPRLWFSRKNMVWFTEVSDGRICPVCDQRALDSSFFPDKEYLEERMVDKNL